MGARRPENITEMSLKWIHGSQQQSMDIVKFREGNETEVSKVPLSSAKDRFQIQRKLYERQPKLKPTETQTHETEHGKKTQINL